MTARPTRGSRWRPVWSTSSTSTAPMTTSARSSSSSAAISRSTPSCASTATSGPNGKPPRPGSALSRWTTPSPPSMTCLPCRRSAMHFGLGKRLTNLPALRQTGNTANRRLLAAQRLSHDPITGAEVLHTTCDPIVRADGTRIPGLRLTDPRAQALLHILPVYRLHPAGFTSRDLRALLGELLGQPPGAITPGQATYDLRRLRPHGLIHRIPLTHHYQVTDTARP